MAHPLFLPACDPPAQQGMAGADDNTTAVNLTVWKAVTTGTPSCRTLAVRPISARPPGAVASTAVGKAIPDSSPINIPMPAQPSSSTSALATAPTM
jgi:hypothetical protein